VPDDGARGDVRERLDRGGADRAVERVLVEVEPGAVEDERVEDAGACVGPHRADEAAGRVAEDDQVPVVLLCGDDVHRLVDLGGVLDEVPHEVGGLALAQGASVLAQVEGVEVPAALGEGGGEVGVEEVVDEAVQVEDGAMVPWAVGRADKGRLDGTFVVGAEMDRPCTPLVAEDVGRPRIACRWCVHGFSSQATVPVFSILPGRSTDG